MNHTVTIGSEIGPLFIEFEEAAFGLGEWRAGVLDEGETYDEVRKRFIVARIALFTAIAELEAAEARIETLLDELAGDYRVRPAPEECERCRDDDTSKPCRCGSLRVVASGHEP